MHTNKEDGEFLCLFIDEDYAQFRKNGDKWSVARLPVNHVEEGSLFMLKIEVSPGTMISTVDEVNIQSYVDLLGRDSFISLIRDNTHTIEGQKIIDNLHERVKVLRDQKIEAIIK
jgi:hypothetical protein